MLLIIFTILFIFIIGLCIGSFLNVVILRALSGESIVFPASKCPSCQHPLKWYHNIPIFSYLFLKGHCAFCNEKISIQYPIIEFITGCVFLLMFFCFGFSIKTLFMWYFAALLIVLAVTDIKEKVIFTRHAYFLIGGGLVYSFLTHNILSSVLGIVLGVFVMEVLARVGYLFAGQRAFGEGDSYIAAAMGAIFGWHTLVFALILSVIVQLVITVPLFIIKLSKKKDYVSISAFCLFFIAVILSKISSVSFIFSGCALILTGGYLCYRLLKDMKKNSEDMMLLPFGPAMVISSFIFLLFM